MIKLIQDQKKRLIDPKSIITYSKKMKQDLDIIEQKLKTIVNLLNDLQQENKVLKDKINNQDETIKSLNLKIYEASQKLENLLGQIPHEELL